MKDTAFSPTVTVGGGAVANATIDIPTVSGYKPILALYKGNSTNGDIDAYLHRTKILNGTETSYSQHIINNSNSSLNTTVWATIVYIKVI